MLIRANLYVIIYFTNIGMSLFTLGLIPKFLNMISKMNSNKVYSKTSGHHYTQNSSEANASTKRTVYVPPIFEVERNIPRLPNTKSELVQLLQSSQAVRFHQLVCPFCNRIPSYKTWVKSNLDSGEFGWFYFVWICVKIYK